MNGLIRVMTLGALILAGCASSNATVRADHAENKTAPPGWKVVRVQSITSGLIGCPTDEIEIRAFQQAQWQVVTWEATCRGHLFQCSMIPMRGGADFPSCAPTLEARTDEANVTPSSEST